METNILKAIYNLAHYQDNDLKAIYKGSNRVNLMGSALEYYMKDLFCDSLSEKDIGKKDRKHSDYFSYIGNQNNPPDFIISGGDAIEVIKTEGTGGIALNSSYPESKLCSESTMITKACRDCEKWETKDIIYSIGTISGDKLKLLWMVYGDCFVADRNVYKRIRKKISKGINKLSDMELLDTESSIVDPLGIAGFLLNNKCIIDNPIKIFDYVVRVNQKAKFTVKVIMLEEKYLSFPEKDRLKIESIDYKNITVKDIKIKSPNNPAKFMSAKLLSLEEV